MTEWEREIFIDLEPDVRVRYCRGAPPPPYRYAVMLEVSEGGKWATVRLWDNADAIDEHHEHEYTRGEGKQWPRVLASRSVNEAMAAALGKATSEWRTILAKFMEEG